MPIQKKGKEEKKSPGARRVDLSKVEMDEPPWANYIFKILVMVVLRGDLAVLGLHTAAHANTDGYQNLEIMIIVEDSSMLLRR
jgi:hypothetical protein